jgi:hypothetical protein
LQKGLSSATAAAEFPGHSTVADAGLHAPAFTQAA